MIYKKFKISLPKNKSLFLIGFGDVHFNCDEADQKHFEETLAFAAAKKKAGHLVRLLTFGDLADSMSTSERAATRDLHDFTLDRFDEWAARIAETLYEKALKPFKGDFLGLIEGHHYMVFQGNKYPKYHGATNTKYLADLLDCEYFGTCGYLTLDFGEGVKWEIVGHHGRGAGQTRSARILKRKRFGEAFPNANAVMVGHDHDLFIEPEQGVGVGENGMFEITKYYVATGSYLRGYILGKERGTYVEAGMMRPSQLGSVAFELKKQDKKLTVSPIIL